MTAFGSLRGLSCHIASVGLLLAASFCGTLNALPVLPGNEHLHNAQVVTWGDTTDPNKLHQHYDDLPLAVNNGDTSWFANKAWDNNGTTTTFHCLACGDTDFGHGFIANRVLYYFDWTYAPPNNLIAYLDRVAEAFNDWMQGTAMHLVEADRKDLVLGLNFEQTTVKPTTEPYVDVRFCDFGSTLCPTYDNGWTGVFDSADQVMAFNTNVTWYTGEADPTPGYGARDFLTTARHEIGHVLGLGHNSNAAKVPGSSIMWGSAAALDTRVDIMSSDFDGVLALYTQPIPEPWSVITLSTILLVLGIRGRLHPKPANRV